MIKLVCGRPQNLAGLIAPNGSISFRLNVDATVVASPYGIVPGNEEVSFQFNAAGQIQPNAPAAAAQIYSNLELNPQNSVGLGTFYWVTFYDQNGARLNKGPMAWQFIEPANSTVDISLMTPYSVVGGNVIFYPIPYYSGTPGTVTSVNFAGDGVLFSSTPSTPIISAGTITPVLLTQNANTVLAGPTTGSAANPTFRALVAADIPANLPYTPVFNVKAYGAVGNGVNDDTAAINNAVAAAEAAATNGGFQNLGCPVVYFPAGVYLTTTGITLPNSGTEDTAIAVSLVGDGKASTVIKLNASGPAACVMKGSNIFAYGARIEHLTISGGFNGLAMQLQGGKGWYINDCKFIQAANGSDSLVQLGISEGGANFYASFISNCDFFAPYEDYNTYSDLPLYDLHLLPGCTDMEISKCDLLNAQTANLFDQGGGSQYSHLHGNGYPQSDPQLSPLYNFWFGAGYCNANNLHLDGSQTAGIYIEGSYVNISNIYFFPTQPGATGIAGILFANALFDVHVTNLTFVANDDDTTVAYRFVGTDNKNVTIIDDEGNFLSGGYMSLGQWSSVPVANTTAGDLTANRLNIGLNESFGDTFGEFLQIAGEMKVTSGSDIGMGLSAFIIPPSTSSATFKGLNVSSEIQSAVNFALSGDIVGMHLETRDFGSGAYSGNEVGLDVFGLIHDSTAVNDSTLTSVIAIRAQAYESFSNSITATITTARGIEVVPSSITGSETLTNEIGITIEALDTATNNTLLLLGQTTPPTGNYAIYSNSSYPSQLKTLILTGTTPTVSSGQVGFGATTASTATSGSATLPDNPLGFLEVNIGGTMCKVPYYAS